jgi:hypothetical protein
MPMRRTTPSSAILVQAASNAAPRSKLEDAPSGEQSRSKGLRTWAANLRVQNAVKRHNCLGHTIKHWLSWLWTRGSGDRSFPSKTCS